MFREYLNEIKTKAKAVHSSKPLWNGSDYLDNYGGINLSDRNITELPCVFPEKWEKGFYCSYNQLTTLDGAPKEVGGDFSCYKNQLTILEGAPREVGGYFSCGDNQLTSLEGAPRKVGGDFICNNNPTKFTEDDVRKVCDVGRSIVNDKIKTKAKAVHSSKPLWNGKDYLNSDGDIDLRRKNLTELPCVFPEKWEKGFYCHENKLTSLEGAPEKVEEDFICSNNKLTSLEGAPKEVGRYFWCDSNQLTTLEGAPKEVGDYFICSNNPTKFTVDDVKKVCHVEGIIRV